MPVVVAGADRDQRDRGARRVEERRRRGRGTAVMGDLEDVDRGQAARDQLRVNALLRVAGEQEPAALRLAQQDDRRVVDARAGRGRRDGDGAGERPQDVEADLAQLQARAGGERGPRWPVPERGVPGRPAGTASPHAGLEHAAHAVALERADEPGHVVLVRVRQHDDVQPPVPRRDLRIELEQEPVGVRAAIDEHACAVPALDEDRVALPDVEHDESGVPAVDVGGRQQARAERHRRDRERDPLDAGEGASPGCGPRAAPGGRLDGGPALRPTASAAT